MNDETTSATEASRRSPGLIILGVLALAVAGWGLADGPSLPNLDAIAWIAVAVAVISGLFLIASGAKASRR